MANPTSYTAHFLSSDLTGGALMLSAPNRYRRLFKNLPTTYRVSETDHLLEVSGSAAMVLLTQEGCEGWDEAMSACIDLQRKEWPDLADRALGLEPHFDLIDVVLTWSPPQKVNSPP